MISGFEKLLIHFLKGVPKLLNIPERSLNKLVVLSPVPDLEIIEEVRILAKSVGIKRTIVLYFDLINTRNNTELRDHHFNIDFSDPENKTCVITENYKLSLSFLALSEADREKVIIFLRPILREVITDVVLNEKNENAFDKGLPLLKGIGFSEKERRFLVAYDLYRIEDSPLFKPLINLTSFAVAYYFSFLMLDSDTGNDEQIFLSSFVILVLNELKPKINSDFIYSCYWSMLSTHSQYLNLPLLVSTYCSHVADSTLLRSTLHAIYAKFVEKPRLHNGAMKALNATYENNDFFNSSIKGITSSSSSSDIKEEHNMKTDYNYDKLFSREESKLNDKKSNGSSKIQSRSMLHSCNII